eukprot:scaffold32224_cov58-Attheya_sp.AAC.3
MGGDLDALEVAVGCVLVAGARSSVGCLRMSQVSERWGVGCLRFGRDGVGGDDDLERSDGMGFAILRVALIYALYIVTRWAPCTRSSTNTGSIQCTLDVILVLFLILVVQVIDALWHCDSRFSEGRVVGLVTLG